MDTDTRDCEEWSAAVPGKACGWCLRGAVDDYLSMFGEDPRKNFAARGVFSQQQAQFMAGK